MAFVGRLVDKWRAGITRGLDWWRRNFIVAMSDAIDEDTFPPFFLVATGLDEMIHELLVLVINDNIRMPEDFLTDLFGKRSGAYYRMYSGCHGDS